MLTKRLHQRHKPLACQVEDAPFLLKESHRAQTYRLIILTRRKFLTRSIGPVLSAYNGHITSMLFVLLSYCVSSAPWHEGYVASAFRDCSDAQQHVLAQEVLVYCIFVFGVMLRH